MNYIQSSIIQVTHDERSVNPQYRVVHTLYSVKQYKENLARMQLDNKNELLYPSFSIIIEWQNIILAEAWRVSKMLQQVCKQIIEISPNISSKPEIIMVHNSEEIDRFRIDQIANEQLAPCMSMIEMEIISAKRLPYYVLKNFAAKHSHHDIIIFLDSDVIPEDGWLTGLLKSFEHPEVRLVSGQNYLPSESLYEKAIGLIHYGPRGSDADDKITEGEYFPGGNLAFRRELFEAFPFPPVPHFRGRWTMVEKFRSHGIKIYYQPKSKASHPAPNGLTHFVKRAICDGHDVVMDHKCRAAIVNAASTHRNNQNKARSIRRKFARTYKRYREADLGAIGTIGAFGILFSYVTLMLIGILIASVRPDFIRRHLGI